MVKVKICGLTRPEDAALAAGLGAWALGVVFAAESPRYVGLKQAAAVLGAGSRVASDEVGTEPLRVGVFVNAGMEEIETAVRTCGLDAVQLHGEESPEFCASVSKQLGVKLIKAVRVSGPESVAGVVRFDTDFVLFDTYNPGHRGGTGETFDWSLLASFPQEQRRRRLVLAGGLGPENIAAALSAVRPFAVDVSSGVELSPGIKDPEMLKLLFAAIKSMQTGRSSQ